MSRLNSGDTDLHNFLFRNFSAIKNTENDLVNQAESADIKILIQFLGSLDLKIFLEIFNCVGGSYMHRILTQINTFSLKPF